MEKFLLKPDTLMEWILGKVVGLSFFSRTFNRSNNEIDKNPTVLIIDEVDVFF
jgi:hypothetical protein